jgi:hypothetical protein
MADRRCHAGHVYRTLSRLATRDLMGLRDLAHDGVAAHHHGAAGLVAGAKRLVSQCLGAPHGGAQGRFRISARQPSHPGRGYPWQSQEQVASAVKVRLG